jgi:hypothetical protein
MKSDKILISGTFADYGENTRAQCMFWSTATATRDGLRPPSSSTWSCNWHGCYAPATIDNGVVYCENPNFLNSDASLDIRITVRVWNANAAVPNLNFCFSHEGQSATSWEAGDFGVFKLSCRKCCFLPLLCSLPSHLSPPLLSPPAG